MVTTFPQVSKSRATYHYFTNMQNFLLTTGALCFLGKFLVDHLGKDVKNFPSLDKISNCTASYFAFYDFASVVKAPYLIYSVLSAKTRTSKDEAPQRADNHYIGVKTWMTCKTISILFKTISSALLVHEAFKQVGSLEKSFSPNVRAIGSGLGAVGFVFDIIDTSRAIYDHKEGAKRRESSFTNKSKTTFEEEEPNGLDTHATHFHGLMVQGARKYDLVFFALVIGVKLMGATQRLNMVDYKGLVGRVSRFAINNTENCYGFLFTAMAASGLMRHVQCGAEIQQLEKHNVNK